MTARSGSPAALAIAPEVVTFATSDIGIAPDSPRVENST